MPKALSVADPHNPLEILYKDNELIEGISFEDYSRAPGINASGLKTILRSPAHWLHEQHIAPKKQTPAFRFGQLLHAAVLEPERFAQQLVLAPEVNLRTNQGKADLQAWRDGLAPDAIEATQLEHETLRGVLGAVQAHKKLARMLERGKREACLFWHDPEFDVRARARMDFVSEQTRIIVDVKSAVDARPDAFSRAMVQFQYSLSASHYCEGARVSGVADPNRFIIVAIEKDPPFGIRLYELSPEELSRGRGWRDRAMRQYAECIRTGAWPGYTDDFEVLEGPAWAPRALME